VDPRKASCGAATILAAGGILTRTGPRGEEIALVHRPAYDDWGLPKGKLVAGESLEEAALREVFEETACEARLVRFVGTTTYMVKGRVKVVSFWLMKTATELLFVPGSEIDQMIWLPAPEALSRMDHPQERDLVRIALGLPGT